MKKPAAKFVIMFASIGIGVAFFLPWVMVDVDMVKPVSAIGRQVDQATGTGFMSGMTDAFNRSATAVVGREKVVYLSGFQIARQGRSQTAEIFGGLMTFLGQKKKDPRNILYLFAIPLAGIILGGVSWFGMQKNTLLWRIAGIVSLGIASFMTYKLIGTSFDAEFAKVSLQFGIWLTCGLFFLLGVLGLKAGRTR